MPWWAVHFRGTGASRGGRLAKKKGCGTRYSPWRALGLPLLGLVLLALPLHLGLALGLLGDAKETPKILRFGVVPAALISCNLDCEKNGRFCSDYKNVDSKTMFVALCAQQV